MPMMENDSLIEQTAEAEPTDQQKSDYFLPAGSPAKVEVSFDPYDAVAVSAFGGINCTLPIKLDGQKNVVVKVHPLAMLLITLPLFAMQIGLLAFLRADVQMDQRVRAEGDTWGMSHNRLLQVQFLVIFIVNTLVFKELLSAVRLLCFLCNPFTWVEIKRLDPTDFKLPFYQCAYSSPGLVIWTWIGVFWKVAIAYMVCVDSISIILECKTAKEAVFNSLVIGFVVEIDESYWGVVQTMFRFNDYDHFQFVAADEHFQKYARQQSFWILNKLRELFPPLSRARNGQNYEHLVAAAIITILYLRQLALILYALDTNLLPSARDVCTQWRWEHGNSTSHHRFLLMPIMNTVEALLRVEKLPDELSGEAGNFTMDLCDSDRYGRMKNKDSVLALLSHPKYSLPVGISLISVLALPHLAGVVKKHCPCLSEFAHKAANVVAEAKEVDAEDKVDAKDKVDAEDEMEDKSMKETVADLKKDLQEMKEWKKWNEKQDPEKALEWAKWQQQNAVRTRRRR